MEIFKIAGFVLVAVVLATLLRQYLPSYAVLCVIAASIGMLVYLLTLIEPIWTFITSIADYIETGYLSVVFKAVGIAIITQNIQDVCKDASMHALAGKVELAGRCLILASALPLFQKVMEVLILFLQ